MPDKYFYKKIFFFIGFSFFLLILLSNFIDFEMLFFPKKYWEKQVNSLENNIGIIETLISDKLLEIKKEKLTMEIDVQQSINLFSRQGSLKLNEETINNIVKLHEMEVTVLQAELHKLIDKNSKLHKKLEEAKIELRKCSKY